MVYSFYFLRPNLFTHDEDCNYFHCAYEVEHHSCRDVGIIVLNKFTKRKG